MSEQKDEQQPGADWAETESELSGPVSSPDGSLPDSDSPEPAADPHGGAVEKAEETGAVSAGVPALAESPAAPVPPAESPEVAEFAEFAESAESAEVAESAESAEFAESAESAGSAESPDDPAASAEPSVKLRGLGLRGARGWAFRDVDLTAHPRDLVAVTGPAGSGRSSLLLAIAGRLRPTTGRLEIAGTVLDGERGTRRELRRVRDSVAIARLGSQIGLDADLSVEENARDAADWVRRRSAETQERLEQWRSRTGLSFPPRTVVAELSALGATALHLLLAAVVEPEVIVLDDADANLTADERDRLWQLALDVAATGPAVIATATDPPSQAHRHVVLHQHATSHVATDHIDATDQDGTQR